MRSRDAVKCVRGLAIAFKRINEAKELAVASDPSLKKSYSRLLRSIKRVMKETTASIHDGSSRTRVR